MLLLVCLAFTLLGSIQALSRGEANEYIDRVLQGQFVEEARYSRLDPYKIDNASFNFNHTGKKGQGLVHNGQMLHLSKLVRAGDCTLPHYQSANVTFTCFLKFDHLKINYTADINYDNMSITINPEVDIKGTNISARITSNREDDVPNLRLLIVNKYGNVNATTNMIPIPSHDDVSSIVDPHLRRTLVGKSVQSLHQVINGRFKDALAYSIYKTPIGL